MLMPNQLFFVVLFKFFFGCFVEWLLDAFSLYRPLSSHSINQFNKKYAKFSLIYSISLQNEHQK